jgi:preprotein translocase SecE subunit
MIKKIKKIKNVINVPGTVFNFLKSVWVEITRTEFPTRGKSYKTSNAVLIGSFLTSISLFGMDYLLVILRTYLTNLNK